MPLVPLLREADGCERLLLAALRRDPEGPCEAADDERAPLVALKGIAFRCWWRRGVRPEAELALDLGYLDPRGIVKLVDKMDEGSKKAD